MSIFIQELREKYKIMEPVFCPYLNQKILFTLKGFKHLLWKTEGPRSKKVILERFEALRVVPEILSKSGTLQEYENDELEFLCFIAIVQEKKYKVIVLKVADGTYRFFSVIPKWKTGKRDFVQLKKPPQG